METTYTLSIHSMMGHTLLGGLTLDECIQWIFADKLFSNLPDKIEIIRE